MRAGLPEREPDWLKRWEDMDIYALQREQAKDRPLFTLHDGPPYANGNIHIGHALNKTLKDLVSPLACRCWATTRPMCRAGTATACPSSGRSRSSTAPRARTRTTSRSTNSAPSAAPLRSTGSISQREEFKRLGVLGDWDNPYLTMSFDAEAQIARELMKVAATGQLYRGSKPVMWSVVERTALAEAEIEYAGLRERHDLGEVSDRTRATATSGCRAAFERSRTPRW